MAPVRLESELGQRLLDRSGRSVWLIEAGSAVLPFARAALDAVANARLAVDELAGLVRGQVTVGMVSGCALPVLAELLARFHQQYPGVAISLTEDNSDRLVEMLQRQPPRPRPDRIGGRRGQHGNQHGGLALVPASAANMPGAPVIVPITPETRYRLKLAWPGAPSGNPAPRVLTEQTRALRLPS